MPDTSTTTAPPAPAGVEPLEAFLAALDEPPALHERRRAALDRYTQLPMPTRKSEEWRYTDLARLAPEAYEPTPRGEATEVAESQLPGSVREVLGAGGVRSAFAVQVDGARVHREVDPELARAGVVFAPLAEAIESHPELIERHLFGSDIPEMEQKLWSLHVAALTEGYLLYVPRNVEIPDPVHVFRCLTRPGILLSVHTLVVAEPGSGVTVIDEYLSPDLPEPALSLAGVEIVGGDNAAIRYLSLQRYGRGVKHFAMQHARAGRDSRLLGFNVTLGGDLSRADVTSRLRGPGSESEMLALWFGDGDQHFDHHTLQHHMAPHARSDLLYKGALAGRARSVFRGLIRVDKGAQLTDAYQTNRNLLLSDECHATTLPNLEIEADDVRCSHGATVGQVDDEQLFYLMARGLDRTRAERLLVTGFFDEVLARVPVEVVRERIGRAVQEKIGI